MSESKRYLLFAGEGYYPAGGWGDFAGFFAEIDEALEAGRSFRAVHDDRWWEVVDSSIWGPVARSGVYGKEQRSTDGNYLPADWD